MNIPIEQTKAEGQPEELNFQSCSLSAQDSTRPISRNDIKSALKKIYSEETKPVNVRSIRNRSRLALMFILLGTFIIAGAIGIEYLQLEQNLMILGLAILFTSLPIGFLISTKYLRKIYTSMSRFKDPDIPAYRRVAPKTSMHSQGIIYAAFLCLLLLGAQSANLLILNNGLIDLDDDQPDEDEYIFNSNDFELTRMIIGEAEKDAAGQYFREIIIEINNSKKHYSNNLIIEIQSWFAGICIDKQNDTFKEDTDFKVITIRVHEPDDTTIRSILKYKTGQGEITINEMEEPSTTDIYITEAIGIISETSPITSSIDITVIIYNDGPPRAPESVSVIISKPSLLGPIYVESTKNNETIKRDSFWETTFSFDKLVEISAYEAKLKLDEKTKDESEVMLG